MNATTATEFLRRIPLLATLPDWQFDLVVEAAQPVEAQEGATLITRGTDDGFTYFLTHGDISLDSADGVVRQIEVTPETRIQPVANLRPRMFGVTALSRVQAVRIPDLVLAAAGFDHPSQEDGEAATADDAGKQQRDEIDSKLGFRLYQDLRANNRVLPTLPDLALAVRKAIDTEESDARKIARLVETDPAMAAKLVKAANSAMYAGSGNAKTCSAAVVRLGMDTTKQLVLTFALKDVFKSRDESSRRQMQALWKHSAEIAALCFVIARESGLVQPEEALLAGLVHDVGIIAILNYAQQYPQLMNDPHLVQQTIKRLRGELGAMILRDWRFSPSAVSAARDAENWSRRHHREADLSDLLIVAQFHERLRYDKVDELPPMHEISAIHRVLGDEASVEKSHELLRAAREHIDEMQSVLSS